MGARVRHAAEEIAAKLGEAAGLAAAGKTQVKIARTLGITVRTYHRSHHARAERDTPATPAERAGLVIPVMRDQLAEVLVENERLKKPAHRLLLEKAELEGSVHRVRSGAC